MVFFLFRVYDKKRASGEKRASLAFKVIMTGIVLLFPIAFVFIGANMLFAYIRPFNGLIVSLALFFIIIGAWLSYLTIKKSKDFDKNFR